MASTSDSHSNPHNAPGPLGCRYDDSLSSLEIQLVVPGIREKKFMRAPNTDVHLKHDEMSLAVTVEVCKVDKKVKPPQKTVVDRRFYEVPQFPGEISSVSFKLKKDACVLFVSKKTPASWQNQMSQFGMS